MTKFGEDVQVDKLIRKYGYKGMMQCTSSFAKAYGYKASDLYQANVSIEIAARYCVR